MANVSSVDVGVLFLIVVTAALANAGPTSRKDVSQRKELEAAVELLPPGSEALLSGGEEPCSTCGPPGARRRFKRCTCYSYSDKECVYYCHLDIIWINTPEHTVPYGMSGYQGSLRVRRSSVPEQRRKEAAAAAARRCVCTRQADSHCSAFCTDSRQKRAARAAPQTDKRTASLRIGPDLDI